MSKQDKQWQRIIGTAGHVDHGKTALVHALTDVDTDTLEEEKERGISINLGFAPLELGNGKTLAFIDVPGHERFIKNMVAGSGGIDVGLLVVAADQGIQPQTKEHLAILQLLGIKQGVVALSRVDVIDESDRAGVVAKLKEDVTALVTSTFLEGCAVVETSTVTKEGLEALTKELRKSAEQTKVEARAKKPFRLYVDRAFSKPGFGTVVTGSAYNGTCNKDDQLCLYPLNLKTTVRRIESFLQEQESGVAGMRLALNLQHADRHEVERGFCLTAGEHVQESSELTVRLTELEQKIEHNAWFQVHWGTSSVRGRILRRSFADSMYATLKLDAPALVKFGDRLILRGGTPVDTACGATVLAVGSETAAFGGSKWTIEELDTLAKAIDDDDYAGGASVVLNRVRTKGTTLTELARFFDLNVKHIAGALVDELEDGDIVTGDSKDPLTSPLVLRTHLNRLKEEMFREVQGYVGKHAENPVLNQATLKKKAGKTTPSAIFKRVVDELVKEEHLAITKDGGFSLPKALEILASKPKKKAANTESEAEEPNEGRSIERIEKVVRDAELTPPSLAEVAVLVGMPAKMAGGFLKSLTRDGRVTRLSEDLYLHTDMIPLIAGFLKDHFANNDKLSIGEFKSLIQSSRKYAVPILECMDKQRFTVRQPDNVRVRGPKLT